MVKLPGAILALILLLGAGAGCKRGGACSEEAARQSVIDYLSKRGNLNVAAMNVSVTSLVCRANDADVTVAFTAKGGNAGQPMSFPYTLEREGDHWAVKAKPQAGGNPHGGAGGATEPGGALPAGHPATGGAMEPGTALPPGHPAVGGGAPKK